MKWLARVPLVLDLSPGNAVGFPRAHARGCDYMHLTPCVNTGPRTNKTPVDFFSASKLNAGAPLKSLAHWIESIFSQGLSGAAE